MLRSQVCTEDPYPTSTVLAKCHPCRLPTWGFPGSQAVLGAGKIARGFGKTEEHGVAGNWDPFL